MFIRKGNQGSNPCLSAEYERTGAKALVFFILFRITQVRISSRELRELREVARALFEEGVAAFPSFVRAIGEARGFTRVDLLADQAVVDEVEAELQHLDGRGALRHDLLGPVVGDLLEFGVGDDLVYHAHFVGLVGGVGGAEEEDFAGAFLAHLAGEVSGAEAAVKARHIGVRLLEDGALLAGEGQVANDMQAVPASDRPAGHDSDDHLFCGVCLGILGLLQCVIRSGKILT